MRFAGKVAIVTGSGQGIGRAIALGLAAEGAKVVTNNRAAGSKGGDATTVAAEIKAAGGEAIAVFGSVADPKESQNIVATTVAKYGRVDILVNNAATMLRGPIINYTDAQIREIINVNLIGCIYCCQNVIPQMARQKYGKIVNISSGAGLQGEPGLSVYSATKYAVIGLTEALAPELGYYNINVNAVCPGAIETRMSSGSGGSYSDNILYREITPEDVAATVLFLASDESKSITSTWIPVTSGIEKRVLPLKPLFTV
jgi:NAD(P)-dependent dehydrogenase (short-subunit alcohol dehydrogenase family)